MLAKLPRKALYFGLQRALRVLVPALIVALPPLYWVVDATRRASLVSLGRDQGIFQYVAWAVLKGDRDYSDVRDVNGPLTHLIHMVFLKLGGADEHVFHVLDLLVTGVAFAFVGACIPGIGRLAKPRLGDRSKARIVREIAARGGWAFAAWVVLSGQYLLYIFWDLAQRESFCDWFLLASIGLQLVGQDRMRADTDAATTKAKLTTPAVGTACLAWAGAFSLLLWFGKPTYALFTVVQIFTLLIDDLPMPRKKRIAWFLFGGALGAASQLLFLVVFGDAIAFFRIYLVDVPTMYKFIWPRSPYEILGLDGYSTLAAAAGATSAVMLALLAMGSLPRRAFTIAVAPLCGLVSVLAQRKGFPYHFHPVSVGVSLQWLVLVAWYSERAHRLPRGKAERLLPVAAAAALSLRVATMMPMSPYVQNLWLLTSKAHDPVERISHDYLVYFKTSDFFPWELRQAASYLRLTTKPDDRVQSYGMDPYVLFLAQRRSATPYIYAYDLNADAALAGGNLPAPVGLHPSPREAEKILALRAAHEADFFARLKAAPPAAFVFHDKAPLITWQEAVHDFQEHCPEPAAWVFARYKETANFNGLRIYLRNDLAESAPRFDEPSKPPPKDEPAPSKDEPAPAPSDH